LLDANGNLRLSDFGFAIKIEPGKKIN